jgi:hypothetical protein
MAYGGSDLRDEEKDMLRSMLPSLFFLLPLGLLFIWASRVADHERIPVRARSAARLFPLPRPPQRG